MGALLRNEGSSTCRETSYVEGEEHSAVRYSANNCWNVNYTIGNLNNNNTNNRYFVVGASESIPDIDGWCSAERSFFKNKHNSIAAQRIHIHPGRVAKLARQMQDGTYKPQPGYCFPLDDPSPREIFAAFCEDRLAHHYVAPFIAEVAERTHKGNGDVSHGNRKGHSAQTGAEQIRDSALQMPDGFYVKLDIRSFFASIPREKAFDVFKAYAEKHCPGNERALSLCRTLIRHDPTLGCVELGSRAKWDKIPDRKKMPRDGSGKGLPIGNFYSQLVANLYLAVLDESLKEFGVCPRFVDDKCCIVPKESVQDVLEKAKEAATALGLTVHPNKVYIQPVRHGMNFCGRTVKGKRLYLSNRTIRRAVTTIRELPGTLKGAMDACRTANSYLGLMRHCTEWKNERRLADRVLERFSEWLYFELRNGHFICQMKKRYTERQEHLTMIINFMKQYNNETRKVHQRRLRAH